MQLAAPRKRSHALSCRSPAGVRREWRSDADLRRSHLTQPLGCHAPKVVMLQAASVKLRIETLIRIVSPVWPRRDVKVVIGGLLGLQPPLIGGSPSRRTAPHAVDIGRPVLWTGRLLGRAGRAP